MVMKKDESVMLTVNETKKIKDIFTEFEEK